MKTILEIAKRLDDERVGQGMPKSDLASRAGVTQKTIHSLLVGQADARLSTVMALAYELGLELTLVPKAIASSVEAGALPEQRPAVRTFVESALGSPVRVSADKDK